MIQSIRWIVFGARGDWKYRFRLSRFKILCRLCNKRFSPYTQSRCEFDTETGVCEQCCKEREAFGNEEF